LPLGYVDRADDASSCKGEGARLARLRATLSSYSSLLAPVQYSVPTLGAVRGKLILLLARNMQESPPLGIPLDWTSDVNWEVRSWYDGWSSPRWAVGDNYQPSSVEMKKGNIDFFLGRVWGQQDSDLIPILFISSVIKPLTASPRAMAQAINPWFIERLGRLSASEFRKRIGFVLMGYLGTSPELCGSYEANGLPYLIVASNFRQY